MNNLSSPSSNNNILMVFDFDLTLTDADTDRWGPEVLAPKERQRMEDLSDTVQWTDLVADTMRRMHSQGITREQIEDAQRIVPFHPAMQRALQNLRKRHDGHITLFIISNSNEVFINIILEHHGLTDLFDKIVTNRAAWTADGILVVQRRVDPAGSQHNCSVGCSANMCKGDELENYLKSTGGISNYSKIIYSGDGGNDFCPILRLRTQDAAFVRTKRSLEARIEKEGRQKGMKCSVRKWDEAWEAEKLFDAV